MFWSEPCNDARQLWVLIANLSSNHNVGSDYNYFNVA